MKKRKDVQKLHKFPSSNFSFKIPTNTVMNSNSVYIEFIAPVKHFSISFWRNLIRLQTEMFYQQGFTSLSFSDFSLQRDFGI